MRIEKETEVTIKVKIGYVFPDDFIERYTDDPNKTRVQIRENTFRTQPMIESAEEAEEVLLNLYANVSDLLQASEITVQDMGIIRE
jgi:hypothetical protein